MRTLREHFNLTRDIFTIDPSHPLDAEAYFGAEPVNQRIMDRIDMDFLARGIPKFFIFGRYGAGKTHTLSHIRHLLTKADRNFGPTEPLITCLPPLRTKDSWSKIHEHIMDEIGRDRVKDAVRAIVRDSQHDDPVDAIRAAKVLQHGDTSLQVSQAQIFRALIYKGHQETKAWDWLKGKALSSDDAAMLETQTNLTNVTNYVEALLNVAALVDHGLKRKLVLLLDEAETIGRVSNVDSVDEFRHAFRTLSEERNNQLGFIVAYQIEAVDEQPAVFSYDAIARRLGFESAYIDLEGLVVTEADARQFVERVLTHLVDQAAAGRTIAEYGLDTTPESFPFTEDAIEQIADFVMQDPERKSPSQIITRMQQSVNKTYLRDRSLGTVCLVDTDIVQDVLHPED